MWFFIDRIVDFGFTTDIVITCRTSFVRTIDGIPEKRASKIARAYLCSWFIIDLIAVLPLDLILILPLSQSARESSSLLGVLRLPKLLRLLRLVKLLKVSKLQRLWRRWEPVVVARVRYGVLRMVRFALVIGIVVHWGGENHYMTLTRGNLIFFRFHRMTEYSVNLIDLLIEYLCL